MASLVKDSDLVTLDKTVRAAFLGAYESRRTTTLYMQIASVQPSSTAKNVYPIAIDASQIREWVGERVDNGLVLEGPTVSNQLWELTHSIRGIDVEDDTSGVVQALISRVRSAGARYARHRDKLVCNVIKNNGTCFDGLALFHASHLSDPSNAGSTTFGNTASGALTATAAASCLATMMEIPSPDPTEPANEGVDVALTVPPALELTARKVAEADEIVFSGNANETNVYKGRYKVIVEPRLAAAFGGSDSYWYMSDNSDMEDRGLLVQVRQEPEMVALFAPTDANVFLRDKFQWGSRARHTAAAANPKKIFRRTG